MIRPGPVWRERNADPGAGVAADALLHPEHALQPAPAQHPGQKCRVRDCQGMSSGK